MNKAAVILALITGYTMAQGQYLAATAGLFFTIVFFYQEPEKSAKK